MIGVGWCWIDQQFFWERIFSFYCSSFKSISHISLRLCGYVGAHCTLQYSIFLHSHSIEETTRRGILQPPICRRTRRLRNGTWTRLQDCDKTFARNSCTPPSDSPRSIEIERSRPTVEKGLTHCYPLVYIVFLTPLSIARLRQFAGLNPSFAFTYAAAAVFDCQDSSTLSSTLQQGKIYSPGRPLCENSDTELLKTNLKHPIRLRITGCIESSLLAILSYPWLL
jgi:hypothetical protein